MFDERIIMSFQTLTHPSPFLANTSRAHFLGNTSRAHCRIRKNPALGLKTFSILVKTNKSGDVPVSKKSKLLLSEANTIGIIGGASAVSTVNFLEKLVRWSSKEGEGPLPFVVCSDPVLSKELLFYDRSSAPGLNAKTYRAQFNPTPILKNIKKKRTLLQRAGAQCIVMPCHVLHAWHDEISKGGSVPFLHIGDCVVNELKEADLKPLEAGSSLRVGLLATDATLEAGFYQKKLQSQGFEVVLPDKETMEHTVFPALVALNEKDMEGARNLFRIALHVLLVKGVKLIILASDEMVGLLPDDDPLLKKCINPMDSLVRSTIKWAQTTEKENKST